MTASLKNTVKSLSFFVFRIILNCFLFPKEINIKSKAFVQEWFDTFIPTSCCINYCHDDKQAGLLSPWMMCLGYLLVENTQALLFVEEVTFYGYFLMHSCACSYRHLHLQYLFFKKFITFSSSPVRQFMVTLLRITKHLEFKEDFAKMFWVFTKCQASKSHLFQCANF